jgi:cell division protein FtsW
MADRIDRPRHWKQDLTEGALAVGIPFALVMVQPDMGTAMSILLAVFFVVILGGLPWRWILTSVAAGAVGVVAMIFAKPYRAARFFAFLNPEADPLRGGYQIIQAKLAFGSGGIIGVGLGMSRQKYLYLPAAHTDFIFAIIGEELGLIGSLSVVVAFAALCYAGIRIGLTARDTYSRLLAGGLTGMIVIQALINMGSVTGLMPITGVPLPLVSYGGSSLVFTLGCIGLVLSVARESAGVPARVRSKSKEVEGSARARTGERRGNSRPRLSGAGGGGSRRS